MLLLKGLKHDFLSIRQLCGKGNIMTFDLSVYRVVKTENNQTIFTSLRSGNTHTINFNKISLNDVCILIKDDESWLWHKRISHIYMDHLKKISLEGISNRFAKLVF